MMRSLLVRGMIAGLLAGLVAFGVAKIVGEPQVDKAIAFEEYTAARAEAGADTGHSHGEHEDELVTRSQQNFAGLGTGALIFGVALGGLFAIVFALAYGRMGTFTARGTAAVLGLLGFVSVFLVPFLKYPATPPAIGDHDTIGRRTGLYLGLILISVAAMVIAVVVRRRLTVRLGEWNGTLVVAGGYVAAMAVCSLLLPGIDEVPQAALKGVVGAVGDAGVTFPGVVLWRFRVSAVAVQVALWATVAIAFGFLARGPLEAGNVPEHEGAAAGH
jgi:hypothetical protein